jgi:hypothetical protein
MSDASNGSENLEPGRLTSIKYKTILPQGKTSGYKQNEKIEFQIPSDIGYFDGKQSYVNLVVRNTTTSNKSAYPSSFPAHVGAHALFNRVQLQDIKGFELENIEQYNLYTGMMNAYGNNSDTFDTISKVEGVAAANPRAENMTVNDPKINYFNPPTYGDVASNVITSGNVAVSNTFCLPINLGLFSAFANEHAAYPNLDIGGTKLTFYLEQAKNALQSLAHNFLEEETIRGSDAGNVIVSERPVFLSDQLQCSWAAGAATIDVGGNLALRDDNAGYWDYGRCGFRVGMEVTDAGKVDKGTITSITLQNNGQLVVQTSGMVGVSGGGQILAVAPTFSYEIDKVELKLLETVPDAATIRRIRQTMTSGINYQTTQLTKISTPAQLVNAVVDIPSAISRGLSIMVAPVQTEKIGLDGAQNSLLYPQMDSYYGGNDNEYNYQWQVRNILIPNRQIELSRDRDPALQNDVPTFYNQQVMSFRPMKEARALNAEKKIADDELSNPFFVPILLSPVGSSYDLVDTDPQLRIENSQSGTPAQILAKLMHVYINHTRKLTATDGGVMVSL